jgi:hypothetical protein
MAEIIPNLIQQGERHEQQRAFVRPLRAHFGDQPVQARMPIGADVTKFATRARQNGWQAGGQ